MCSIAGRGNSKSAIGHGVNRCQAAYRFRQNQSTVEVGAHLGAPKSLVALQFD